MSQENLKSLLCDDCLRQITFKLSQDEILLLQKMYNNNIVTPQLSADEPKLITLVKNLSPYKIKFVIQRFLLVSVIDSVKVGTTKYYLTDTGKKLLNLYVEDTMKLTKNKK